MKYKSPHSDTFEKYCFLPFPDGNFWWKTLLFLDFGGRFLWDTRYVCMFLGLWLVIRGISSRVHLLWKLVNPWQCPILSQLEAKGTSLLVCWLWQQMSPRDFVTETNLHSLNHLHLDLQTHLVFHLHHHQGPLHKNKIENRKIGNKSLSKVSKIILFLTACVLHA